MYGILRRSTLMLGLVTGVAAPGGAQTPQQPQQSGQATGQTDAWVVTAHLKARMAMSPTDTTNQQSAGTALVRSVRSGGEERIEFSQNPNAGPWEVAQLVPIGLVVLTTVTDTNVSVTLLDSAFKQYTVANIHEIPPPPPGVPPQAMANIPVSHVSDIVVTVDSVGPGPVLQGHPTVHYRQTQRATIQTDMGKMLTIIARMEGVVDLDIATDIPDAPRINGFGLERVIEFPHGLALTPDLAPAIRAAAAKYPRGVILHLEGYQTAGPMTRVVTLDTDKWERTRVDASLLTVPAGYRRGMGFMMGGMPGFPIP